MDAQTQVAAGPDDLPAVLTGAGPPDPARPSARPRRRRGEAAALLGSRYALVGVWLAMAVVFLALKPEVFGQFHTFEAIFGSQQVLVLLCLSALSTLVVGEFDLSFAAVMGVGATIIPVLAELHGVNLFLSCVIAVLACVACGAVNAFFVVKLGVPSLVVTLGTGTLLIGVAQLISDSVAVSLNDRGFSNVALYDVLGMPISFYYGIGLAAAFAYVCGWTPLGRHALFVGSNPEVARLAGIRVNRIRAGSYLLASLFSGLGSIVLISSVGGFEATASASFLLPALAAVFLSTAVVQPGQFNPIGAMIGVYFLSTGIFGLQLLGFSGWIQDVFYGGGLVVAVALATIVRQRTTRL